MAAIGPAGENLVRCACIIGNRHVAWGRTGMGAVMGSKNLKAIAAYGTGGIPAAQPIKLLGLSRRTTKDLVGDTKSIETWREGGTWKIYWDFPKPALNPDSDLWVQDTLDRKIEHHPVACPGCPVGCKHALKIRPGYKYEGLELTIGCTFSTMNVRAGAGPPEHRGHHEVRRVGPAPGHGLGGHRRGHLDAHRDAPQRRHRRPVGRLPGPAVG